MWNSDPELIEFRRYTMSPTTISLGKKIGRNRVRQPKSFPWLGLFLVMTGLGLMFYFIGPTDVNKIGKKETLSFLGGASGSFKN
jgi:hypothetical protein